MNKLSKTVIAILSVATSQAATVLELADADASFAAGPLASFHAQDFNGDGVADDRQDMAFRFTFTTPTALDRDYLIFETGRFHIGTTLLLKRDRLLLIAGGDTASASGLDVLQVASHPLAPSTRYEVVFALQVDRDGDGNTADSRGAIYVDGVFAADPTYPGSQIHSDIRAGGVADWSGTGPGGFGEASSNALYVEEGSAPTDFAGDGFSLSDGSLDGALEFFANTFLDRQPPPPRPNILLITADDLNADTVGAFAGPVPSVTPNIDRLASEGMKFLRAHVSIGVCQPSRECLLTGLYPHNNGGEGFEPIDVTAMSLAEVLDNLDYRLGVLSKGKHVEPASEFRWDLRLDEADLAEGRHPERYYTETRSFIEAAAGDGRPFFLMANSNDPHRPYHGSAQEANRWSQAVRDTFATPSKVYAPDEITVPGFLPDLPAIRTEIAQYFSSARRCDDTVGRILDALDDAGAADNTIVIFLSDNGIAVPFAKTNVWLHSTRTPMIIRWPGEVAPASTDERNFVSGIDLMPTLLDAIGVGHGASLRFDGTSFLPLLRGEPLPDQLDHAVTVFHETSGRRRYEMRAVQSARYGYIFNAWSDGATTFRNESQNGLTWNAMVAAGGTDPSVQARVDHFRLRSPEEFYDYVQDPDAIFNLNTQGVLDDPRSEARATLLAWMARTGDPLRPEFEAFLDANPLDPVAAADPIQLGVDPISGEASLQFTSRTNLLYQILSSSDLTNWQPEGDALAGSDVPISVPVPGPSGGKARLFYTIDSYLDFSILP